ncbi:NADPH-dependent 7-cyano-7-deazaguanine reductase [compost metagenome]
MSFRNEGHFHEDVTNRILKDFVEFAQPRKLQVIGKFSVRGGIYTTVRAEYEQPK